MISIKVTEKDNQKRLDRFMTTHFKSIPKSAVYKAIRTGNIKVDGIKVKENIALKTGNLLDIYIKDKILYNLPNGENSKEGFTFEVIYEDENLLLVNKKPGIPVDANSKIKEPCLIDMVIEYLDEKRGYNYDKSTAFIPTLCHRLDRNTGGIVIIAKTSEALEIMLSKIKNREIKKYYKCMVIGAPIPAQAELKHFLFKDKSKSQVYVSNIKKPGYVEIITRYKVLQRFDEMSLLEIELVTGRTHQIRAHLAYIGNPIAGDGKYGINKFNHKIGARYQALWAYKIVFDFKENNGILEYLKGKTFETSNINFGIKNYNS